SFFVIFRQPAAPGTVTAKNFPVLQPMQELPGPWQVQFVPRVGKSFTQTFQTLENWTQRAEPDIKHFSGTAKYKQSFDLKSEIHNPQSAMFMDLGAVHVMARVVLNGQDLGVVLEISVANLWINRLIGDAGLPQEQRQTWTTRNPFKKDSPLQPSGLLGPVKLFVESKL
ncbi:MAG: glycoside hydrolase family 2, partial [Kiritimatiellaeota bacterium]|nr:glycoside hydrolase family 2 [Kiritimatiellota bacterium]